MATQRQSAVRPVLTSEPEPMRSPTTVHASRLNSLTAIEEIPEGNEAVLHPSNEATKQELDREIQRRAVFEKVSNKIYNIPDGYRKVEVLIVRWDESIDEFKGHNTEASQQTMIKRLQTIFKIGYKYNCRVVQLKTNRNPQLDLNFEILKHVHDHDDDDTLLIVYYTGHGNHIIEKDGTHHLELTASKNVQWEDVYAPTALWDIAEEPLRTQAGCDVLAILDCCFASTAALKGRNDKFRTYQLLAASPAEGVTSGPGKRSFTTALCDSLETLLQELEGAPFPVLKLFDRINRLRPTQPALLWDRLQHYNGRSVNLGRLESKLKRTTLIPSEEFEKASLLLRISLKKPDLDIEDIESLAKQLPMACKSADIPVRKIEWMEMKQFPERIVRDALHAFKSFRTRSSPGKLQKATMPLAQYRRTRSTESLPPSISTRQGSRGQLKRNTSRHLKDGLKTSRAVDMTTVEKPVILPFVLVAVTAMSLLLVVPSSFEDRLTTVLVAVGVLTWVCSHRMREDQANLDTESAQTPIDDKELTFQVVHRSQTWPFQL